jgi:arylsulfatase A-like enzyme
MKRLLVLGLVLAAAGLMLSCSGADDEKETVADLGRAPVVILAIDGLRADAIGCYGGPAATPAFDALAADSIRFEWAFAQAPQIQPSLAALFSGLYPTTNALRSPGDSMADDAVTVAEILDSAGYSTAAFMEGGPGSSDYGLAQGFDSYQTLGEPGTAAIEWMKNHATEDFLLVFGGWSRPALEKVNALLEGSGRPEGMDIRIQEVLASRSSDAPVDFDDEDLQWARTWYAARVQVIDGLLDGFMNEFRALGLDRRAILVVMGSNGFALQEHGDLFGESLYPSVTHVPVFMRMPEGRNAQTVSKFVEVIDLMPTILEMSGHDLPAGVQGASLMPIIDGGGQPPYVAFAESPQRGGQRFVALGGMAMVSGVSGAEAGIFDLAASTGADLAADAGDKVEVMVRHLQAWEKMVSVASLDPELRTEEDLDEDTLKQLKSLGYIQ